MNWPTQHPRTPVRDRQTARPYVKQSWGQGHAALLDALNRLARESECAVRLLELSTAHDPRHVGANGHPLSHAPEPSDPGVAAWITLDGNTFAIPCDGYQDARQNLRSIINYIHQMARTSRDRVGNVDALFQGFKALPATASLAQTGDPPAVQEYRARIARGEDPQRAYRTCAFLAHPDRGGSDQAMALLNEAHNKHKGEAACT